MHGRVVVLVVAVVVAAWMMSVNDAVAVIVDAVAVPVSVRIVVDAGAVAETASERTEVALPPTDGVTGLGLKPPVTPDGKPVTVNVTGELKPPRDWTVTTTDPDPLWLRMRALGLAVRVKAAGAVTVKTALAESPAPKFDVAVTV
jgi:hypothetical protein